MKMQVRQVFAALCLLGLALVASPVIAYELHEGPTGVTKYKADKSFGGYTLFAPTVGSTTTYLINMEGDIVHSWKSKYPPDCSRNSCPTAICCAPRLSPKKP